MRGLSTTEFIEKSQLSHPDKDKYDYSQVNFVRVGEKVKIICPVHGIFEQKANRTVLISFDFWRAADITIRRVLLTRLE